MGQLLRGLFYLLVLLSWTCAVAGKGLEHVQGVLGMSQTLDTLSPPQLYPFYCADFGYSLWVSQDVQTPRFYLVCTYSDIYGVRAI